MTDHPIPSPSLWGKTTAQQFIEIHPCASGCRGDCGQGDRDCEFVGIHPAEAVSEYVGPQDWESAGAEPWVYLIVAFAAFVGAMFLVVAHV